MTDSNQPKPDQTTPASTDVPASTDPKDINQGLAQSPEMSKLEVLQNKVLALHESMKLNLEAADKLSPDMAEEREKHHQIHLKHVAEIEKVAKEIEAHHQAAGKNGPARAGAGKTLHFPDLDRLIDIIMKLLKKLIEMIGRGVTMFRDQFREKTGENAAGTPGQNGQESAKPEGKKAKSVIGMNVPGGGIAVNPPAPAESKATTPEQAESAAEKAVEAAAERQQEIRRALAAEAQLENDNDGPAPGSTPKKPK